MWQISRFGAMALTSFMLMSCKDNAEDANLAPYRAQIVTRQGQSRQGVSRQGTSRQGTSRQGISRQGISRQGISRQGSALDGITIEGSQFKGTLNGTPIAGTDIVGAILDVTAYEPAPTQIKVRIDSAAVSTHNSFGDVWQYGASVLDPATQTWVSLCHDADGNPETMTPVSGMYWNESTWSRVDDPNFGAFLCHSGALSKCVDMGYRPWAQAKNCRRDSTKRCSDVQLRDYHESCQRMMTADYCGVGVSYTLDGTWVDIFDYLDPPVLLREAEWTFEARWQPTGAMCISQMRHPELGFTGKCKDSKGKERTLSKCNPYEEEKGYVVSTFNGTGATGVKNNDK